MSLSDCGQSLELVRPSCAAPALRDYQQAALALALDAIANVERFADRQSCYVNLPTGTGKGEIIGALTAQAADNGSRIIVVCHREAILVEPGGLADRCRRWCGPERIGIVMAGSDDTAAPVIVGSIQTLSRERRLRRVLAASDRPVAAVLID